MSTAKHSIDEPELQDQPAAKRPRDDSRKSGNGASTTSSGPMVELVQQAAGLSCTLTTRQFAKCMDRIDPLRHLRDEFEIPKMSTLPTVDPSLVNMDEDGIYMVGNSLGLMPRRTREIVEEELNKWSRMGVLGHFSGRLPWSLADEVLLAPMAKLVGANENEVAFMNGLSVNLHLLLVSFYQPTKERHKILIEEHAFPSDHYVAESQIRFHGFEPQTSLLVAQPQQGERTIQTADILDVIEREGDSIAVILLPGVQYYTGQVFDMKAITKAGHQKGCLVGFDLAHAVGNIELHLHAWDVDFAAWCTYKYLNSGAGALAGAFVHDMHALNDNPRFNGWWSHKMSTRFDMDNKMNLAPGISGYRISNPSFMAIIPVKASLEVFSKTSMSAVRKKSLLMTAYLEYLVKFYFSEPKTHNKVTTNNANSPTDIADAGDIYIDIITPSDPSERGCQLSFLFNTPVDDILAQLLKRGVLCDERKPNVIRIAPAPLYTKFEDVWRFTQALRDSIQTIRLQKMTRSSDELD